MQTKEDIALLQERLGVIREAASRYFSHADPVKADDMPTGQEYWAVEGEEIQKEGEELRATIKRLSVDVAGAARSSPLVSEADLQDLRHNTRQMLASVRYNRYQHHGVSIHHDEGVVLGVDPPTQHEEMAATPEAAIRMFDKAILAVRDLIDLLSPAEATPSAAGTATYRPNTAFIMMALDKSRPELEDVKNAIKDVFRDFDVSAVTADEIEHDDAITDRILNEIETSEFLIADLTGERPNVYYEVGHAHARNKRVMLFRRDGTKLHFDLAHRNCPEYANVTALKDMLRKRLEIVTNRPKKP
jgi:hypothetical protein